MPQQSLPNIKFRLYATILDGYQDYLNSDSIWERYWGWSDNPPHTMEEFRVKHFQSLIDRINRVPFDSEAADRGTAFNEVIDCLIEHRKSPTVKVQKAFAEVTREVYGSSDEDMRIRDYANIEYVTENQLVGLYATYNNRTFYFDINLCREFADYFKGALTQQLVKGALETAYGNVELYGYVDELMPQAIHDIKTTGQYSVGKFKDHWQHRVYPYCYYMQGIMLPTFEYNIVEFDKYNKQAYETFTETYSFVPERDIPILR